MKTPRSHLIARHFALLGLLTVATLPAQTWTATNLHPADATASYLQATTGSQQVGYVTIGGGNRPALWSGTASSFVGILVGGSDAVFAATTGTVQAGYSFVGPGRRAMVRNAAGSVIYLGQSTATASEVQATTGSLHAGYATFEGVDHAGIWTGPSNLFQDLQPFGATSSEVNGTTGTRHVGNVTIDGILRATMWSPSRTDLHPPAAGNSNLFAIAGTQQAGFARFAGAAHAGIWSGTAASFVDIHPPAATQSTAYATTGAQQAGFATIGGNAHAAVWFGTAASFIDLHTFLPSGYSSSTARGIWTDGSAILVAGYAYSSAAARNEAMLWRFTPNRLPAFSVSKKSIKATTKSRVTIKGECADAEGKPPRIFVKVGGEKFRPAKGNRNWSFEADLNVGKNKIQIYAIDSSKAKSPTRKFKITRR